MSSLKYSSDETINLSLDVGLYSRDAILNTAYLFTNKCHVDLRSYGDKTAEVIFTQKPNSELELDTIAKDFLNELIEQQLRVNIDKETKAIKELIVKEAFAPLDTMKEVKN